MAKFLVSFICFIGLFGLNRSQKQEKPCSDQGGTCKKVSQGCVGQFLTGKCPTQGSDVKCCVPGKAPSNAGASKCNSGDKFVTTVEKIFGHEGTCQNSAADKSGNMYQGKMGYTCMGITPETGFVNRNKFPGCSGFSGHAADFVKWCYDKSSSNFKAGATEIYKASYFNVCNQLEQPAFYVCSDISVNSGPGRSQAFMKQLGSAGTDMKSYAKKMNELHRQFYKQIGGPNLQGWLNRANARDQYIDSC